MKRKRQSRRLKNYDYSQIAIYFVTIASCNRQCLFGKIINNTMVLNHYGQIVHEEWIKTGQLRNEINLDQFVIMPNHFHGIVIVLGSRGKARRAPTIERFGKPTVGSLPTIIRSFKSAVTKRINDVRKTPGNSVWQRNYHERIIRNDFELNRTYEYIRDNPKNWHKDKNNPLNRE